MLILVLIIHARRSPVEIITRGIIFITVGSINILLVNKVSHLMALPAMMDIIANNIIGLMIFIFSLIDRNELERFGPQSTTNLNRTE